jgi:hypothetical protein
MKAKKHQTPAKEKYDASHPIVSFRCSPDLKQKLEYIRNASDKTVADVLREAVGLQTPSVKAAYEKGKIMAELRCAVQYRCPNCGKYMTISSEAEKQDAAAHMEASGWCHEQCPD